ncbi:hypothetical protein K458DRAFT_193696 [Lentithecium fluviatile CBS 122367]|uniref:Uncharacterized protein n=1 Tax=Lentithecium fluviatile CBS 122367 TaxID=1168545 RepID=A0A6G1IDB8_9PLEO|nr:hypothetical protein K458DRAFT_193696 [Lentithecium fluviatile CBS 122367]
MTLVQPAPSSCPAFLPVLSALRCSGISFLPSQLGAASHWVLPPVITSRLTPLHPNCLASTSSLSSRIRIPLRELPSYAPSV